MAEEDKVWTKKIGSVWHGYHRDYPQIDERGLTEEMAKRKVVELVESGVLGELKSDHG